MDREVLTTSGVPLQSGEYSIASSLHQRCAVCGVLYVHFNPRCGEEKVDTIKMTIQCCPMQCSITILQRENITVTIGVQDYVCTNPSPLHPDKVESVKLISQFEDWYELRRLMRTATWGMELEWDHQPMEGEEGEGRGYLGEKRS